MSNYIFNPIAQASDYLRTSLGSISYGPALSLSKSAITSLLSRIEHGTLIITDHTNDQTHLFGQNVAKEFAKISNGDGFNGLGNGAGVGKKVGNPKVELKVLRENFWVRLFLFGDMGFAEAYMLGDIECDDLTGFFMLFIRNRNQLSNATTLTSSIAATITGLARSTNTLSNSLLNVSAHYNISNEMFAAFLSEDMTYSCPIWAPTSSETSGIEESLESAQMTKLNRFIQGCHIKPSDHVLEIGTGWGSFAIEVVRQTGCHVTSLTLSIEQKALAEKRIAAAGFSDNITVLLMDYRRLPTPKTPYDKIVSIEMLEAVGREYLITYFSRIHELLKKDGGIAMFQCITMPEARYEAYAKGEDFIRKYIFPGGHLPNVTQLLTSIEKGSEAGLVVERVENIGGHYAKTLRLWGEKFGREFEGRIKGALKREHEGMGEREVEVFRRKWEYYFTYCEAGFASKTLGDVIITVGREGALELMEGIPL